VAIVSYDEKTGMQAIATTAPDLPPKPGVYATFARDHEYKPVARSASWLASIWSSEHTSGRQSSAAVCRGASPTAGHRMPPTRSTARK
jgi:hypothetical protein